jgi:hypothetical protein
VLLLDQRHDRVAVEALTVIEEVEVRRGNRVELGQIVSRRRSEDRLDGVDDLLLIGRERLVLGDGNSGTSMTNATRVAWRWRFRSRLMLGSKNNMGSHR